MAEGRFATSISCMDGRIQLPIMQWIKDNYPVDFVDTITEPGIDSVISHRQNLGPIMRKAEISINAHRSQLIVISGHHDCAGNPVPDEEQLAQIKEDVLIVKSWGYGIPVVGVWVDADWTVQEVA